MDIQMSEWENKNMRKWMNGDKRNESTNVGGKYWRTEGRLKRWT